MAEDDILGAIGAGVLACTGGPGGGPTSERTRGTHPWHARGGCWRGGRQGGGWPLVQPFSSTPSVGRMGPSIDLTREARMPSDQKYDFRRLALWGSHRLSLESRPRMDASVLRVAEGGPSPTIPASLVALAQKHGHGPPSGNHARRDLACTRAIAEASCYRGGTCPGAAQSSMSPELPAGPPLAKRRCAL